MIQEGVRVVLQAQQGRRYGVWAQMTEGGPATRLGGSHLQRWVLPSTSGCTCASINMIMFSICVLDENLKCQINEPDQKPTLHQRVGNGLSPRGYETTRYRVSRPSLQLPHTSQFHKARLRRLFSNTPIPRTFLFNLEVV
jgi:hypothetical protein